MIAALKEYREDLRKQERKDITLLFMQLFNAGRADDVQRAVREPEYLDKLMAEFGYSDDDNKDDAHQSQVCLDRWNTAKSLYEAIQIPKAFRRFIPDLPINLIEVAWLEDAVIDKFQSDFQVVA